MPDRPVASAPVARCVFVYGTLRRGGSNDIRRFAPQPRFVSIAEVRGSLFDLGSYPALRLEGEGWVQGEIFEIDPFLERQLDRLEEVEEDDSGEYVKRKLVVRIDAVRAVNCLVYEVAAARVRGRSVIGSGDWIAHRASAVSRR